MKQQAQGHRTLLRTTQIAIAGAAFALLAACGGGGGSSASATPPSGVNMQVVSFGTSLSDVGTYQPALLGFGGGRFTTNPGEVWTQMVAEYFGGKLTPAFEGALTQPLVAAGGLGYAQGGAQVSLGGTFPAGTAPDSTAIPGASQESIQWQIGQYLSQHVKFNANQLVLVEGGANEILNFLEYNSGIEFGEFAAAVTPMGTNESPVFTAIWNQVASAAGSQCSGAAQFSQPCLGPIWVQSIAGYLASSTTGTSDVNKFPHAVALYQAAADPQTGLVSAIGSMVQNGAEHIAFVNVPDIGKTPAGSLAAATAPGADSLLTAVTAAFNGIVQTGLIQNGLASATNQGKPVVLVDSFTWLDTTIANASSFGFTNTNGATDTACDLTAMYESAAAYAAKNNTVLNGQSVNDYAQTYASSLFCSSKTLVTPNAATTYMFADQVHPTTALHTLFAKNVETTLAAAGIGKAPQ